MSNLLGFLLRGKDPFCIVGGGSQWWEAAQIKWLMGDAVGSWLKARPLLWSSTSHFLVKWLWQIYGFLAVLISDALKPHLSGANGSANSNSFSQHMLWFSFFQIVQSGGLIVATMCGHLFCSGCLPVALETVGVCPTSQMELPPDLYFPIYIRVCLLLRTDSDGSWRIGKVETSFLMYIVLPVHSFIFAGFN